MFVLHNQIDHIHQGVNRHFNCTTETAVAEGGGGVLLLFPHIFRFFILWHNTKIVCAPLFNSYRMQIFLLSDLYSSASERFIKYQFSRYCGL